VNEVLEAIGAAEVPVLRVINKIDLTDHAAGPLPATQAELTPVCVSALTGAGLPELGVELNRYFSSLRLNAWLNLPAHAGRLRARLFEMGAVEEEQVQPDGVWAMRVNISNSEARQLCALGNEERRLICAQLLAEDATAA
jgi:GTP-binding protein HflX